MTEVLRSHEFHPSTIKIIEEALDTIEAAHGEHGTLPLAYHNERHTIGVMNDVSQLADRAIARQLIRSSDKELLMLAAAKHDEVQTLGSGKNERASARSAMAAMRAAHIYSEQAIQQVRLGIMGTEAHVDTDGMIHQSAANYFAKLLADADLASLGKPSPMYWDNALRLFHETHPGGAVGDKTYNEFVASQIPLLTEHHFYTQEAEELFPHKQENIAFIEDLLAQTT